MVSAKLHLIWLSEELKTVHRFCSIFKRNLQLLCLQWKWFHPQLTIWNVPQSAQSPKRTPEVSLIGSNSLTLQLLPKSVALWDLSCICTLPSLITAPTLSRPQSSLGWIVQQALVYLLVLDLPALLFILCFAAMAAFLKCKCEHLTSPPTHFPVSLYLQS